LGIVEKFPPGRTKATLVGGTRRERGLYGGMRDTAACRPELRCVSWRSWESLEKGIRNKEVNGDLELLPKKGRGRVSEKKNCEKLKLIGLRRKPSTGSRRFDSAGGNFVRGTAGEEEGTVSVREGVKSGNQQFRSLEKRAIGGRKKKRRERTKQVLGEEILGIARMAVDVVRIEPMTHKKHHKKAATPS